MEPCFSMFLVRVTSQGDLSWSARAAPSGPSPLCSLGRGLVEEEKSPRGWSSGPLQMGFSGTKGKCDA